jgi:hypothetical protein
LEAISPRGYRRKNLCESNNPAAQALHVIDIYIKTKNGLPVDGARPTYSRQRPAIYNGTQSIALDAFFEIVTQFRSNELESLKFRAMGTGS